MKLWATLAIAGALVGSAFASTSTAPVQDGASRWTINVGFAIPEGDHKDAGVDNMFVVGADWFLSQGMMGASSTNTTYIGVLGMFGDGDFDLESMTFGVHYGVLLNLGNETMSEWMARLQGGLYNTRLEMGSADSDEWGFGGMAAIVYTPRNSSGFNINAGYYFYPEVEGVDNRGWYIGVGIPIR